MTAKQTAYYWREWAKCWRAIKARQPSVEAVMFAPYPAADAEEAKPKATTKGKRKLD